MPQIYSSSSPVVPQLDELKSKDLGLNLDIGGDQRVKDLRPDERLARDLGSAVTETIGTGINFSTKLPLVSDVAKGVAESPIGFIVGKAFDLLNVPSWMVQQAAARFRLAVTDRASLPEDIARMLNSGQDVGDVADYLVNSQRAFSNDKAANLIFQILLDPLNFTPLALGKVGLLKPLATAAGAVGGGLVGSLPGAVAGGIAGYKMAGRASKSLDAALIAGKKTSELSTAEKIVQTLDKGKDGTGYGLDLKNRVASGAKNLDLIASKEAELEVLRQGEKSPIVDQKIKTLESEIEDARNSIKISKGITNGFSTGLYNGFIGVKQGASSSARALAGALTIPYSMKIVSTLGGERFNQMKDSIAAIFPEDIRGTVEEMIGRGASEAAVFATARLVTKPETALADAVAEVTTKGYFEAIKQIGLEKKSGVFTPQDLDNIANVMAENAKANTGGLVKTYGVSDDAPGIVELRERVRILSQTDELQMLAQGRLANPSKARLMEYIENTYVAGKLAEIAKMPGGVEARIADIVRGLGVEGVGKLAADEIEKAVTRLAVDVTSMARVKEMYVARLRSIASATNTPWTDAVRAQADQSFDVMFRSLFDEAGYAKPDNIQKIARQLLVVDYASYASSNKIASRINETIRPFLSKNPDPKWVQKMIERHGEDGYADLRRAAQYIGNNGVQVVRKNSFIRPIAVAYNKVYETVADLETNGIDYRSAVQSQAIGEPAVARYVGTEVDVQIVKRRINELMREADRAGDTLSKEALQVLFRRVNKEKPKNLAEFKKVWAEASLEQFETIAAQMGRITDPQRIHTFIRNGLDEVATNPLDDYGKEAVYKLMAASGVDPSIMNSLNASRYLLVRSPNRPYKTVSKLVENPNIDDATKRLIYQHSIKPYVDMTSPYIDEVKDQFASTYKANRVQEFMSRMFDPISTTQVNNNIRTRMSAFLARGGISAGHIDRVMDEVVFEAMSQGVSARGIGRKAAEDAFERAFKFQDGFSGYDEFKRRWSEATTSKSEFSAYDALMYGFRGDAKYVGLTQSATGKLKEWMPSIATMTDNFYPKYRFKANPLYWIQEFVESDFLNGARGVDREVVRAIGADGRALGISAADMRDLSKVGPETSSLIDQVSFLTIFREKALSSAVAGDWKLADESLARTLKRAFKGEAGEVLALRKEVRKDALALDITAKNFAKELQEKDPELWNSLVVHHGTADSRTIFVREMDARKRMSDPDRVLSDIESSRPAGFGWRVMPDRSGKVLSEAKADLLGDIFDIERGAIVPTDINLLVNGILSNPSGMINDLDITHSRLFDAGYDVTIGNLATEMEGLKRFLYTVQDTQIKNPGWVAQKADDIPQTLKGKLANIRESFRKIDEYKIKANYRKMVIEEMFIAMGSSRSKYGNLSFEGGRIAEALALGHGYGPEISDVTTIAQRIVSSVDAPLRNTAEFESQIRRMAREAVEQNPDVVKALDNASYRLIATHGTEEKVYRAVQYTYEKALKQANITTYANPDRSFFERTINHPFLGFYPYSYMFKKILPEMVEFLFKRPFGAQAPGAGYQAYIHVRDYVEGELETDYGLRKMLQDNDQVAFLVSQLFPGVPWDITALPPAWARAILLSASGRDKDYQVLSDLVGRDVLGNLDQYGPLKVFTNTVSASQQIVDTLSGANEAEPASGLGIDRGPNFDIYGGRR